MAKKTLAVDKNELETFIKAAIKETVNGKIDRIAEHLKVQDGVIAANQAALTKHIETLKPYIEGADFLQKLYHYTKWLWPIGVSLVAAYLSIKNYFPKI